MQNETVSEIARLLREVDSKCDCSPRHSRVTVFPGDPTMAPFLKSLIFQISKLREQVDFRMHTFEDDSACKSLNIPQIICASDLASSDAYFNSLRFRCGSFLLLVLP